MTTTERYRNDNPRTADEILEDLRRYFGEVAPEAGDGSGTANRAHLETFANTISENQEQSLVDLYDATFIQDATGKELTKKAREVGVRRKPAIAATGVVTFSRDSTASQDYVIQKGVEVSTGGIDPVSFVTTEQTTLTSGSTEVDANVKAVEAGVSGNVSSSSLDTFVTTVEGVNSVINDNPTGDANYTDTNGEKLQVGRNREDDSALRDRALDATSIGGASTAKAIETALMNIKDVITADFNYNPKSTSQDGLDPYHGEVVVYGSSVETIAETLEDTMSVTNLFHLQGGVHGTKATYDIYVELLDQTITIPITRPTETQLAITVDIVHDSTYAGKEAVKRAIVDYIGGTDPDGSNVIGLGQGEDVIVDELDMEINSVRGVIASTDLVIDADSDGTDDTTTDSDGVTVYDVASNEVPRIGSVDITVNETPR